MRIIHSDRITEAAEALCIEAACVLPDDVVSAIELAVTVERSPLGRSILEQYLKNADIARTETVPICQDTGVAVYFVRKGKECRIEGEGLEEAIQRGTTIGYTKGYLRKSIVVDPLFDRRNSGDNSPAIIHVEEVDGEELNIILAPKGAGSENMSRMAMLKPLEGVSGVIAFVVDTVLRAAANPCPPTVIGVGIGGNFEHAPLLAKKALIRTTGSPHPDSRYAELERRILEAVNATGIGPQGLGGSITAFAVHIETAPCHIASLPVAVNLNCHAARHAGISL